MAGNLSVEESECCENMNATSACKPYCDSLTTLFGGALGVGIRRLNGLPPEILRIDGRLAAVGLLSCERGYGVNPKSASLLVVLIRCDGIAEEGREPDITNSVSARY